MAGFETRRALHWSAFFIVWLLAVQAHADACRMPPDAVRVHSRDVFDGDTLELTDGRRVRLIGINAPEIGRKGSASQPFARAATDRLQALVGNAPLYLVPGQEPRDRYGRTLAHLFDAAGHNIEAQLLSEGLGFAIGVPPNLAMVRCHVEAEEHARSRERGLWASQPVVDAASLGEGGFQVIQGRVQAVEKAGRFWWLALEGDAVLRVHEHEEAALPGKPESMVGQRVEARGWVIDRRGQRSVKAGHQRYMLPIRDQSMLRKMR